MLSSIGILAAHACATEPMSPGARASVVGDTQATPANASGLEPSDAGGGWRHSIALYFIAAGIDGSTTVKGVDADVDVSFSDILENLEMGAMIAYRGETERYAITLDTVYMGLGAQQDDGPISADVDVDELVVELDAGWRVSPLTEVFLGARYWGLSTEVELAGPSSGTAASADKEWIDPLIGVRHTWPLAEDWSLTLRGDVGGFGVGSEFSWQALARANWHISKATALTFGYRALDVDYQDGSGTDEFRYDVLTSGFLLGLIYAF